MFVLYQDLRSCAKSPLLTDKQKSFMCIRSHVDLLRQYAWTLENLHHNLGTLGQTLPLPEPTLFPY